MSYGDIEGKCQTVCPHYEVKSDGMPGCAAVTPWCSLLDAKRRPGEVCPVEKIRKGLVDDLDKRIKALEDKP